MSNPSPKLKQPRFWTRIAMNAEVLVPRLLPLLCVIALFAIASWFGWFRSVPDWARLTSLAAIFTAALGSLTLLRGIQLPGAKDIDDRLERDNAMHHRPITTRSDHCHPPIDPPAL